MSINLLLIFFVLIVVAMIAFILVQKGAGATAGSAFGSGASSTVFGAKGSGNFLTKTTMILAFLFFALSMLMAVNANREFTAAATGDVDLGVMGTLDTSSGSDVPEMTATPDANDAASDVPVLESGDANQDAVDDVVTTSSDVPNVDDLSEGVSEMKNNIEDKAEALQSDAEQKIDELKTSIEENVDAAKDAVDGEG